MFKICQLNFKLIAKVINLNILIRGSLTSKNLIIHEIKPICWNADTK